MRAWIKGTVAGVFVLAAAADFGNAHANLITNGDFATDAAGWTYNNLGVDGGYLAGSGNPPGSFWINHNGSNVGADADPRLSHTILTNTGTQYRLTFDYAGFVITGGTGLAADVDGTEQATYSIPNSAWNTTSLLFTAAGAGTTIAFRSEINGTDFDARIDNVIVEAVAAAAVPAPAGLALFGAGLVSLALLRLVARRG